MDAVEIAKLVGSLSLTTALGIAVVVLWRTKEALQAKYEALIDRYHTTLQELIKFHQQLLDAVEKEDKK